MTEIFLLLSVGVNVLLLIFFYIHTGKTDTSVDFFVHQQLEDSYDQMKRERDDLTARLQAQIQDANGYKQLSDALSDDIARIIESNSNLAASLAEIKENELQDLEQIVISLRKRLTLSENASL